MYYIVQPGRSYRYNCTARPLIQVQLYSQTADICTILKAGHSTDTIVQSVRLHVQLYWPTSSTGTVVQQDRFYSYNCKARPLLQVQLYSQAAFTGTIVQLGRLYRYNSLPGPLLPPGFSVVTDLHSHVQLYTKFYSTDKVSSKDTGRHRSRTLFFYLCRN